MPSECSMSLAYEHSYHKLTNATETVLRLKVLTWSPRPLWTRYIKNPKPPKDHCCWDIALTADSAHLCRHKWCINGDSQLLGLAHGLKLTAAALEAYIWPTAQRGSKPRLNNRASISSCYVTAVGLTDPSFKEVVIT